MKAQLKFSGVKVELQKVIGTEWEFDFRPGGWVVASRELANGKAERRRFFYQRSKDRFFAKFTDGTGSDFYGQKIEAARTGSQGGGANDFTAQFPGKVRKLLVKDGDEVAAGAPIMMVEAMKMEFAIKSETPGTVKKILVQEGQQLTPGQKLLDFEEKK